MTDQPAVTVDAFAIRMFRNEQKRHQDAALSALREARDTLTRALTAWERSPSTVMLASEARRAAIQAAEGTSRAEALNALHDVRFLVERDSAEPMLTTHNGEQIDARLNTP